MILSVIETKASTSERSQRMCATDLIAMLASGGILKEREAEKRMSASFLLVTSSLLSSHSFFSSQTCKSLAEETGLGEARIWVSRSGQRTNSQFQLEMTHCYWSHKMNYVQLSFSILTNPPSWERGKLWSRGTETRAGELKLEEEEEEARRRRNYECVAKKLIRFWRSVCSLGYCHIKLGSEQHPSGLFPRENQHRPPANSFDIRQHFQPACGPEFERLTKSQRLFSLATQMDVRSLNISGDVEFYLFMEMRAEGQWVSFRMTPPKWVSETSEYNSRMQKRQAN